MRSLVISLPSLKLATCLVGQLRADVHLVVGAPAQGRQFSTES